MNGDAKDLKGFIAQVATGRPLSSTEAETAFGIMMSGNATPSQMGGFLMALRVRGETVEELTGAVRAMRAKMLTVKGPENAIDTCGTGGDAKGTLNISTASSFVVAACGVPVAKHGNRALSSKSGAADVLMALGVNIEADIALMEKSLREAGTCFLMAPRHHSAMRHVGPTRVELGTRTIFNLLGPLSNPAGIKRQIVGVFAPEWVEPIARVLKSLGHEKAWVVHGSDGLDELSNTGPSCVAQLDNGEITTFEVTPEEAGLPRSELSGLIGGDAKHNAAAMHAMLDGAPGAFRDAVLLGSAGALIVADKVSNLKEGVGMAAHAIDSGGARKVLNDLIAITNSGASS
jgi:anthranilate phosphoribosyltransferase